MVLIRLDVAKYVATVHASQHLYAILLKKLTLSEFLIHFSDSKSLKKSG